MEYFEVRNTGSDNFVFCSDEEYPPCTGMKISCGLAGLIRKINEPGETR